MSVVSSVCTPAVLLFGAPTARPCVSIWRHSITISGPMRSSRRNGQAVTVNALRADVSQHVCPRQWHESHCSTSQREIGRASLIGRIRDGHQSAVRRVD
ncbi:hypothetical protein LZ32DRAFT_219782 [Colletotrichum eremochloae]|nr:hypothetical protein LZ32DRAFT_219782 [Colletotrichum eremochloae]